jgi:hypothetical protein
MKKQINNIIIFFAVLLFCSCGQSDAIDDLTGKYPIPQDVTLSTVSSKSDSLNSANTQHIYNLTLTGDGESMTVQFVCSKTWYLEARTYTMANTTSEANIGNFIAENTSISNGTISSGSITVAKSGDTYTIDGVFMMKDGSVIRPHFSGNIVYTKPEPKALIKFLGITTTALTSGYNVNIKFGTEGLSVMSSMWGNYIQGTGEYVSIDFICNSTSLAIGTYIPVSNGSTTTGTFVEGYEGNYNGYKYNAGSCYYSLDSSGNTTVTYLTSGTVTVVQDGANYTITADCGAIYVQYTGTLQ